MVTVQSAPRLTESEEALLEQIACEVAAIKGRRYKTLKRRFDAVILTNAEYEEYLISINKIEELSVKRLECLVEMAERRNMPLVEFMRLSGNLKCPSPIS